MWIHISLSLYSRNSPGNELGSWLLWQHGDADGISQDLSHYSSSLTLLSLTIPSFITSLALYLCLFSLPVSALCSLQDCQWFRRGFTVVMYVTKGKEPHRLYFGPLTVFWG